MKKYVSPLTFADRILVGMSQIMDVSVPSAAPQDSEGSLDKPNNNAPKIV